MSYEEDIDEEKDINQEMKIQEFNDKFDTFLNGNENELNFWHKNNYNTLCDNGFKLLCEIKFPKLINLKLDENKISNINYLENFLCESLRELSLQKNMISDISVLAKSNFPFLKKFF